MNYKKRFPVLGSKEFFLALLFALCATVSLPPVAVAEEQQPGDKQTQAPVKLLPSVVTDTRHKPSPPEAKKARSGVSKSSESEDVDFGPYMANLQRSIKKHWFPPKGNESKRVVVVFDVLADGTALNAKIQRSSGVPQADKAALKAINDGSPYAALPAGAPKSVAIEFSFDYNVIMDHEANGRTPAKEREDESIQEMRGAAHSAFKNPLFWAALIGFPLIAAAFIGLVVLVCVKTQKKY
jgi:TonB family protein